MASIPELAERLGRTLRRAGYDGPFDAAEVARKAESSLRRVTARGWSGPRVDPRQARRFVEETLRHARDVVVLTRTLGGKAQPHDIEELAPVSRIKPYVERGIGGRPAPGWLKRAYAHAVATGATSLDVSKLVPEVLAGLATSGRPDRFALERHRLARHHRRPLTVESAADVVNAMRMPRVYKTPMSFPMIQAVLVDQHRRGFFADDELALLRRAVAAQRRLEREGRVTDWGGRR